MFSYSNTKNYFPQCLLINNALPPQSLEHQGTKAKFWYVENGQNILFKKGKIHGENWAEVIASEMARFINLPSAEYYPAEYQGEPGVITPSFINSMWRLIPANELFIKKNPSYALQPMWKRKDYKLNTALVLIEKLQHNSELPLEGTYLLLRPPEQFIGYLLFDCLIANLDRHDENWGFIHTGEKLILAPSYDHASSLACREPEKKRIDRLTTKDKGYSIESFAAKAKTPFRDIHGNQMKTSEVIDNCHKLYGYAFNYWATQFSSLSNDVLVQIMNSLPEGWMTETEKQFTIRLIEINRDLIVNKANQPNR